MGRNVEIKAQVNDFVAVRATAERISDGPPSVLEQEDTFFPTPTGRLKLRRQGPAGGELIFYRRSDACGPKLSAYDLVRTDDPVALAALLGSALGVRGVVRKRRTLFFAGRTRIHLDEVERLGAFLELEVVLQPGEPVEAGEAEARELMERLGVGAEELRDEAYIDLLERRSERPPLEPGGR